MLTLTDKGLYLGSKAATAKYFVYTGEGDDPTGPALLNADLTSWSTSVLRIGWLHH